MRLRRATHWTPKISRWVLAGLACAAFSTACDAWNEESSAPPKATGTNVPTPPITPPKPVDPDFSGLTCGEQNPVPSQGRLLTRLQYELTIRDLFGGLVTGPFATDFPLENKVLGFGTNAEYHRATSWLSEGHMKAAEAIGQQAVAKLSELLPCSVSAADAACANDFIQSVGAKAFRRPLTEAEQTPLRDLFALGSAQSFAHGIELVLQAMLQSPQFLYRFDSDRTAPVGAAESGAFAVSGYEMASRMSYFLWNTMPDAELFDAAAQGTLSSAEEVRTQARRMLLDPRAKDGALDFFRQWLTLQGFDSLVREYQPAVPAAYANDWRGSLELFLQQMLWGQLPKSADAVEPGSAVEGSSETQDMGTLYDLFTSNVTYLNPALAALYGVTLPDGAGPTDFFPVELDPGKRAGLLTQPGLMALVAHSDQTAPIQRGVFVRDQLLCQPAPPPPPTVNAVPPELDPGLTTRQRFTQHTADVGCAGCHTLIDPLGLPFEGFDQLGRHRDQENGFDLDLSGGIVGVREAALQGDFNGPIELGQRLAGSTQVRDCVATQWYRYGSGRVEQDEDLCSLAQVIATFQNSGGNFGELMVALVSSDAFRYRSELGSPVVGAEVTAP